MSKYDLIAYVPEMVQIEEFISGMDLPEVDLPEGFTGECND